MSFAQRGAVRNRLPNADSAVIGVEKLRDYILSTTHPVGRFKATFFAALGYRRGDWMKLERDLRLQHLTLPAKAVGSSPHGQKFRIEAPLRGPAGRSAVVVSIWIIRDVGVPHLVTLYPGGPR
jgi:hypothetical protein